MHTSLHTITEPGRSFPQWNRANSQTEAVFWGGGGGGDFSTISVLFVEGVWTILHHSPWNIASAIKFKLCVSLHMWGYSGADLWGCSSAVSNSSSADSTHVTVMCVTSAVLMNDTAAVICVIAVALMPEAAAVLLCEAADQARGSRDEVRWGPAPIVVLCGYSSGHALGWGCDSVAWTATFTGCHRPLWIVGLFRVIRPHLWGPVQWFVSLLICIPGKQRGTLGKRLEPKHINGNVNHLEDALV